MPAATNQSVLKLPLPSLSPCSLPPVPLFPLMSEHCYLSSKISQHHLLISSLSASFRLPGPVPQGSSLPAQLFSSLPSRMVPPSVPLPPAWFLPSVPLTPAWFFPSPLLPAPTPSIQLATDCYQKRLRPLKEAATVVLYYTMYTVHCYSSFGGFRSI